MRKIYILIAVLIFLLGLLIFRSCYNKDGFSSGGCQTEPQPGSKDCKGLLNYLSAGLPTIEQRGDVAFTLLGNADFWNTCSMDQIKELESNVSAFSFADLGLPGPWSLGVNDVVTINEGNGMSNNDYCRLAKTITTTPINDCQADNYKQYMANISPQTQATLQKWLSYC